MGVPMTGYDTEDRYYATGYIQGGRKIYSIDLSLAGVAANLPRPDPSKPTLGNRQINDSHARGFGKYVREEEDWIAPALLLRTADVFKFEVEKEIAGTRFGILSLPRPARADLRILDGQHRILGLHYAVEEIAAEIEKRRSLLAAARRQGHAELVERYESEMKNLEDQRTRLHNERISVQIYIEEDAEAYKQMFVDIADNARGITSTIRARFDHRKVVNRALATVLRHALLVDRVDLQQDRIRADSPNLMGAKHVAYFIKALAVGISRRIGRRVEDELNESHLAEKTNNFLDVLMEGFPALNEVVEGRRTPERLRKTSLLGSTTMLRVLSGVYYELAKDKTDDQIKDFFASLAPHLTAPIVKGSPWLTIEGEIFSEGASAPKARWQDLEKLTKTIVGWYDSPPQWLKAA